MKCYGVRLNRDHLSLSTEKRGSSDNIKLRNGIVSAALKFQLRLSTTNPNILVFDLINIINLTQDTG